MAAKKGALLLALALGLVFFAAQVGAQAKEKDEGAADNDEDGSDSGLNTTGTATVGNKATLVLEKMKANYDSEISPQNAETPPTPTVLRVSVALIAMNGVDVVAGTLSMTIYTQVRVSTLVSPRVRLPAFRALRVGRPAHCCPGERCH
jgi:hypothetical protein